ncbi:MAG: hypothetical protein ABI382_11640 [Nakamurella sp.]
MPIWGWIIIGVAIGVALAVVVTMALRASQSNTLKKRFGPEYERTVSGAGHRQGEAMLLDRKERREHLDILPLAPVDRDRFIAQWRDIQNTFVDRPGAAVTEAATLLTAVMSQRGYPVQDFDEQADLISVDHPDLVQGYRAAQEIRARNSRNEATTEELRGALLRFRALFSDLLETGEKDAAVAADPEHSSL